MNEIKNERVGTWCPKCLQIVCVCNKPVVNAMKVQDNLIEINSRIANLSSSKGRILDLLADSVELFCSVKIPLSDGKWASDLIDKYNKAANEMGFTIDWNKGRLIK